MAAPVPVHLLRATLHGRTRFFYHWLLGKRTTKSKKRSKIGNIEKKSNLTNEGGDVREIFKIDREVCDLLDTSYIHSDLKMLCELFVARFWP